MKEFKYPCLNCNTDLSKQSDFDEKKEFIRCEKCLTLNKFDEIKIVRNVLLTKESSDPRSQSIIGKTIDDVFKGDGITRIIDSIFNKK